MTTVLIITNSEDGLHTDSVIHHLRVIGSDVVRLDTDKVTSGEHQILLKRGDVLLRTEYDERSLLAIDSIWLRRMRVLEFNVTDVVQRRYTEEEFRSLLAGIYSMLENKRWLNTPWAMDKAKHKVYQLRLATSLGFLVPEYIVTADPDEARDFCALGQTVFKPLAQANIGDREKALLIPTTLMTEEHVNRLELIRSQYVLLQRYIRKCYELRMTYINGELFVARQIPVDEERQNIADWRLLQVDGGSSYTSSTVSDVLREQITSMMKELHLSFATLDFVIDNQGEHYFLEVNPNGQWYGYTEEIGMPASLAIAKFLST